MPTAVADQVEAAHHVGQCRDLAARNRNLGLARAFGQPDRDAVRIAAVGPGRSRCIDHRERARRRTTDR